MNQGQRFNPINQVPFSGPYAQPYPLPFNHGAPQPHPLKQNFNHGAPQPHLVPQQFHNQSTNNDRSWIDKAFAYRAFTQNQQAQQPYNQHQVQTNYQRDQLTHAPYSRAPFGYPPISVNQYYFNYPRGAIKSPQVFNARDQSNQRSSTPNAFRNFQPVSIYHNSVSYGHQIKPSFSPGYNQGFVAQRIPIPPYYAQPYAQPYAQNGIQSVDSLVRQGYTNENQSKGKMVALSDQKYFDFLNKWEAYTAEVKKDIEKHQAISDANKQYEAKQPKELKKQLAEHQAELEKKETYIKETHKINPNLKSLIASTNNPTVVHIQEGVKSTMGFISGDAHSSCQEDRSANNPDVQLYETNKATDQTNQSSTSWPISTKDFDDLERHVPSSSPNITLEQLGVYPNFFKSEAPLRVIGEGKPQEHEDLCRQKPMVAPKQSIGFGRA